MSMRVCRGYAAVPVMVIIFPSGDTSLVASWTNDEVLPGIKLLLPAPI